MIAQDPPGDPDELLWAVLIYPQLRRFRQVYGLEGAPLHVSFTGWHRFVVLSPDRCFAIPRSPQWVPTQRHEARVLRSLDHPLVPRFVELREDPEISPYPILVTERRHGRALQELLPSTTLPELLEIVAALGRAVASWHELDVPAGITAPSHLAPFAAECRTETLEHNAQAAAAAAGLTPRVVAGWLERLRPLLALPDVLVHGDLHEGQVLLDEAGALSAVLDWETAGPGHPAKDFDLGEWDGWIFAEHEPDFAAIRRAGWSAYTQARGLDLDPDALHLFFTITDLARLKASASEPASAWHAQRRRNLVQALRAFG